MTLVERLHEAKVTGDYAAMFDLVPYARFLGLAPKLEGDELITAMTYAPPLIGNASLPAIHGGAIGALLESAAIFELLYRAETIVLPKTITVTVDYLRSAGPADTFARGVITRHGRRVANVRVEAWQGDRSQPVATAHGIFLVMRDQPAAP
jgi:acyl-coenzyme A thioesterase PaaI-like protein